MRTPFIILPALLVAVACGDDSAASVSRDAPPAAAVLTPGMDAENLEVQLASLYEELGRGLEGEPDRLLTAEAISDRLIHAERAVDWLAPGYGVEARLRQIQSMADRVVAQLRRGATLEGVSGDVETLRLAVQDLQQQLELPGGGDAPLPLDSLLQQDPLRDVEAPSARVGDSEEEERELPDIGPRPSRPAGPLGTPVDGAGP